jgi:hypothetical protein
VQAIIITEHAKSVLQFVGEIFASAARKAGTALL